jgi:PadR family transcriptional regulator PadR
MLGVFEQAVVLAVVRLGKEAYGRAILTEVQERLQRDVSGGAIQATLARLEHKGLLNSRLGPGSEVRAGRPKRFYTVGPAGVRALNEAHGAVSSLWRGFRPRKGYA